MRSRWAQENVFKYLKEEFGLDSLPQRGLLPVEPHTRVVNPAWRLIRKALDKWSGDDLVDGGDCVIGRGVFD